LRSPPPPEYQPSSEEEDDSEEGEEDAKPAGRATRGRKTKGKVAGKGKGRGRGRARSTAKKMIIVGNGFRTWEAPHFSEYPVEIVGLVLLRVLAERPIAALNDAQRVEVKQMLEGLRQDIGIGPKLFDVMTALCMAMVLRRRSTEPQQPRSVARPAGGNDRWWWEFDDALQAASSRLSTTKEPSLFAGTLAKKASAAAAAAFRAREAATAQTRHGVYQAGSLARLEQALGLTVPSNVFLKTIGEKLAQARQDLLNTTAPSQPASTAQRKRKQPPTGPSPPPKRRKPSPEEQEPKSSIKPASNDGPSDDEPIPLPCTYCSESGASRYRAFAQRRAARLGGDNSGTTPKIKPWTNPLMWAFHLPQDAANRITKANDWFRMVASSRSVRVVQVPDPDTGLPPVVKFMVDVTGGKTRVVLMELKGVFETVLERDIARVRFEMPSVVIREDSMDSAWKSALGLARPVGRWEIWRGGRLEGFSEV
jgi:hypothetical protein